MFNLSSFFFTEGLYSRAKAEFELILCNSTYTVVILYDATMNLVPLFISLVVDCMAIGVTKKNVNVRAYGE